MSVVLYSAVSGLIYGLLLFMLASGLTLVFGLMGVVNFAHTAFYMLGAYFAWKISLHLGFWAGLVISPVLVAAIGLLVEVLLLRPIHRYGHGAELLVTFGLLLIFEELVKVVFGTGYVEYALPAFLNAPAFTLFGLPFPYSRVLIGCIGLVMFGLLSYVVLGTRLGIIVRSAVRQPVMVGALGHNVPAILAGVFALGAWMAGLAGVLGGALLSTSPQMALQQAIPVFVVVVVGGLGSLRGALIASLLIGVLSSVTVNIDVSLADLADAAGLRGLRSVGSVFTAKISAFAASIPTLLMLLILLLRPAGMSGDRL
jgi:branched-chain amino acid transport system permease protein